MNASEHQDVSVLENADLMAALLKGEVALLLLINMDSRATSMYLGPLGSVKLP